MFDFNHEKYDFWPIYDSIVKHYPIGIRKDETEMYLHYPGLKQLELLVVETIHHTESDFSRRWRNLEETLEKQTDKMTIGTTYGQFPSFSSNLVIEKIPSGKLTWYKELCFTVSLLGPYYTVFGRDKTEIFQEGKDPYYPRLSNRFYYSTPILTVSPEEEYADVFRLLCGEIEDRFQGYRFVPYSLYRQRLQGLEVIDPYVEPSEKRDKIFHALFHDQIDFNAQTVGIIYYKSNDWIKEGYQDNGGGWAIYPPGFGDDRPVN
jgi:hypothetical protein